MCNRYLKDATWEEEVAYYKAIDEWRRDIMATGAQVAEGGSAEQERPNYAAEVYPGYPGTVLAEGELRVMHWGFPRVMRGKSGQMLKPRPVNNTRSENLGSPFWRDSFAKRRCLIPLTGFAEAEGEKGAMTCTWITRPDQRLFSVAGIWRWSEEWGEVYSMMMTEPCDATACVHDRMPVMLRDEDCRQWTDGTPEEALELCRPWQGAVTIRANAATMGSAEVSRRLKSGLVVGLLLAAWVVFLVVSFHR